MCEMNSTKIFSEERKLHKSGESISFSITVSFLLIYFESDKLTLTTDLLNIVS
jgi:hypothetical protein